MRTKDPSKSCILVHTNTHIDRSSGQKLAQPRRHRRHGLIPDRRRRRVDEIGAQIRRRVQRVDEEERRAEEEAGWTGNHSPETGFCGLCDRESFGGFFDDGSSLSPLLAFA